MAFFGAAGETAPLATLDLEWDPAPRLITVTASPPAVDLSTVATQTFTLGFEAPGSTIVKLKDDLAIGSRSASTGWLDYQGMLGPAGSGTFTPSDIGLCTDKPAATKTDTFQVQDDLEQVSNALPRISAMAYPTVCSTCQPTGRINGCLTQSDGCGHPIDCSCPQGGGCVGSVSCGPGGACVCIPP